MDCHQGWVQANGIELHYEDRGNPHHPVLLLIMGLGAQMTYWPEPLINALIERGFRVVRFDNRDIGLSSKCNFGVTVNMPVAFARYLLGRSFRSNYTLYDMAEDATGLLDALGIERAHVVGVSMGGMIGKILAAKYPDRVASLAAIMSSSNHHRLPLPRFSLIWRLSRRTAGKRQPDLEQVIQKACDFWEMIRSPGYSPCSSRMEQMIRENYQRSFRPKGVQRQMHAILATGSLAHMLQDIRVPTRVIHGGADPLLRVEHGQFTAARIPLADLRIISGMGHDLPEPLLPRFTDWIHDNAQRAENWSCS